LIQQAPGKSAQAQRMSDNKHHGLASPSQAARVSESRKVGLARALSKLGFCSRSRAAELIRAGRVRLNGATRRNPEAPVHLERDQIDVDGNPVEFGVRIYLVLNKSRGLVTTASDEKGRETIYSLLDKSLPWIGPVGRLDKASEGLLLLTNDTEWAARISDPESHLSKTYHVQVRGASYEIPIDKLLQGVSADQGLLRAKNARILRAGEKNTWLEIVLDEGKNRHIRRMLDALGIEVLRLVRVAIGPLALGSLPKGTFRTLTTAEKGALDRAIADSREQQGGRAFPRDSSGSEDAR
jgi:23S rRNA pseudouridine2605 synthase